MLGFDPSTLRHSFLLVSYNMPSNTPTHLLIDSFTYSRVDTIQDILLRERDELHEEIEEAAKLIAQLQLSPRQSSRSVYIDTPIARSRRVVHQWQGPPRALNLDEERDDYDQSVMIDQATNSPLPEPASVEMTAREGDSLSPPKSPEQMIANSGDLFSPRSIHAAFTPSIVSQGAPQTTPRHSSPPPDFIIDRSGASIQDRLTRLYHVIATPRQEQNAQPVTAATISLPERSPRLRAATIRQVEVQLGQQGLVDVNLSPATPDGCQEDEETSQRSEGVLSPSASTLHPDTNHSPPDTQESPCSPDHTPPPDFDPVIHTPHLLQLRFQPHRRGKRGKTSTVDRTSRTRPNKRSKTQHSQGRATGEAATSTIPCPSAMVSTATQNKTVSPLARPVDMATTLSPDSVPDNIPVPQPQQRERPPMPMPIPTKPKLSVLDAFEQYFDKEVYKLICDQSNKYHASHGHTSQPFDRALLAKFFAVLISAGLQGRQKRTREWWSENPAYNFLFAQQNMTRTEFETCLRYLHFTQHEFDPTVNDRAYKVRPFLDIMRERFKSVYRIGQHVTIDEAMIPLKSRLRLKQFIPSKPDRWGVKMWVLADSKSGYVQTFQLYQSDKGYDPAAVPEYLISPSQVVFHLMQDAGLLDENRIVYTDNLFTSVGLAHELLKRRTHLVGTMRKRRKHFPFGKVTPTKQRGDSKQHMFHYSPGTGKKNRQATSTTTATSDTKQQCNETRLFATGWEDNRTVYILSTFNPSSQPNSAKSRRWSKGERRYIDVDTPSIIRDYNEYMGGVDIADAKRSYYKIRIKQLRRWYLQVVFYLLDTAINNAHIIYHEANQGRFPLTNYAFRAALIEALVKQAASKNIVSTRKRSKGTAEENTRRQRNPRAKEAPRTSLLTMLPELTLDDIKQERRCIHQRDHITRVSNIPVKNPRMIRKGGNNEETPQKIKTYRKGAICAQCKNRNSRTSVGCKVCNVPLHVAGNSLGDCWIKFHQHHRSGNQS